MKSSLFLFLISLFVMSCKHRNAEEKDQGPLLAELNGKKLYYSTIENMLQAKSSEDSVRILKGLVMNWVGDQLMVKEAEKNMPDNLEIDKLLEEYKSSLLLYNYETKLSSELLDTFITEDQKKQYFDAHKDDYELAEPILKYKFAKIPAKTERLDEFYKKWKSDDELAYVADFCKKNAGYYDLDDNKWRAVSDLEGRFPSKLFPRDLLDNEESIRKKDDEFEYFVKVQEYVDDDDKPPFDYIQFKIEKVLLNERKKDLIANKKAQLFAKEGNKAKIYVN